MEHERGACAKYLGTKSAKSAQFSTPACQPPKSVGTIYQLLPVGNLDLAWLTLLFDGNALLVPCMEDVGALGARTKNLPSFHQPPWGPTERGGNRADVLGHTAIIMANSTSEPLSTTAAVLRGECNSLPEWISDHDLFVSGGDALLIAVVTVMIMMVRPARRLHSAPVAMPAHVHAQTPPPTPLPQTIKKLGPLVLKTQHAAQLGAIGWVRKCTGLCASATIHFGGATMADKVVATAISTLRRMPKGASFAVRKTPAPTARAMESLALTQIPP